MLLNDLPEICTPREIARAIKGFTERDIKEDCRAQRITHYKRNTKIVIYRDDFLEYLESLKCQRKTEDTGLSGAKTAIPGKSFGMKGVKGGDAQQAQQTARALIRSSRRISKQQNVVQFRD